MKLLICLWLFSIPSAFAAVDGPRVGNGGGGWFCSDGDNLRWAELADLYETRNDGGGLFVPLSGDVGGPWDLYNGQLTKIRILFPKLAALLKREPVDLRTVFKLSGFGSELAPINDAFYRVRPSADTCQGGILALVQLANFSDDGRLVVNGRVWRDLAFSPVSRAALLLHERIYYALRLGAGDRNSTRARRIVGILFSSLENAAAERMVNDVLSSPAPTLTDDAENGVAGGLSCVASVTGEKGVTSAILASSPLQLSASLSAFRFSVVLDAADGRPLAVHISETGGGEVQLDAGMLAAAFRANTPVTLTLTAQRAKASLRCQSKNQ